MHFNHLEYHSARPQAAQPDERLKGLPVLLVEDEPDIAALFTVVLTGSGAEVIAANSAQKALSLLKSFSPDILISNILLPNHTGDWLIHKIRRREKEQTKFLPAIAVTSYSREVSEAGAPAAGFQRFLSKPIEPETIVEEVIQLNPSQSVLGIRHPTKSRADSLMKEYSE